MKISNQDIKHIINLARLHIEEHEIEEFTDKLTNILNYIDKLKEIDEKKTEQVYFVKDIKENKFREDIVEKSPGPNVTLSDAPEKDDNFYIVPNILQ